MTAMGKPAVALSVIIPTHSGSKRIDDVMASLAGQTLDLAEFEVVVIVNGPHHGYATALQNVAKRYPALNLRVEFLSEPGVSRARNVGLDVSVGRYVTFVDDDDWLQPRFLELGLAAAGDDRVVVLPLIDQLVDTGEMRSSPYGVQTEAANGQVTPLASQHWILMFNACKVVPRAVAVQFRYDEELRSGEDLVYFSHFLTCDLLAVFIFENDAHYVRRVRQGSVSRQSTSFDFLVTQRLACITRLAQLGLPVGSPADESRMKMIRSQANSLLRWLDLNPDGRDEVVAAVDSAHVERFPRGLFNKGHAEKLVFLHTFGSAVEAQCVATGEAQVARESVTDVISAETSETLVQGPDSAVPVFDALDTHTQLAVPLGQDISECVTAFAFSAARTAARRHGRKPYRQLYSRAPWAGAHAAGALFKLRHWPIVWTAEFSDFLRGAPGDDEHPCTIVWDAVTAEFRAAIDARGFEALVTPSTCALIEAVTMLLADTVVFSSPTLQTSMLDMWGNPSFTELVLGKSAPRLNAARS